MLDFFSLAQEVADIFSRQHEALAEVENLMLEAGRDAAEPAPGILIDDVLARGY